METDISNAQITINSMAVCGYFPTWFRMWSNLLFAIRFWTTMLDQTGCKFPNRTFLPTWTWKITINGYSVRDVRISVLIAVTKRTAILRNMTPQSVALGWDTTPQCGNRMWYDTIECGTGMRYDTIVCGTGMRWHYRVWQWNEIWHYRVWDWNEMTP
jgi:hypothetical protein